MEDKISSYVEEIVSALGEDADTSREEIEKELRRFLEYGVPPEQAKESLVKKFGGEKSLDRKLLGEIGPNEQNINLLCKIVTKNEKGINVKGEMKKIYYGLLEDESAVLPFTSWRSDFPADKGDVIEIKNAYSREWQGVVQINIGDKTLIRKIEGEEIQTTVSHEPKKCKIIDLYNTFGPIEIKAKILSISDKEIEIDGTKRRVFSGILGDETGKARFTAWHDFGLKEGDVVKISGGYARFWKGIPQVIFDERSKIDKLPDSIEVGSVIIPLHKLVEMRGGIDISTEGTIIEIREGSGYIERCPECGRLLKNNECKIHGKVKGIADLRLKMIVDDGNASIGVIVNRELTEKLIDKSLEECKEFIKSKGRDKLMDLLKDKLITKRMRLKGNALGDEFGTTLIAKDAEILNVDTRREAQELLQIMEAER